MRKCHWREFSFFLYLPYSIIATSLRKCKSHKWRTNISNIAEIFRITHKYIYFTKFWLWSLIWFLNRRLYLLRYQTFRCWIQNCPFLYTKLTLTPLNWWKINSRPGCRPIWITGSALNADAWIFHLIFIKHVFCPAFCFLSIMEVYSSF